MSINELDNWTKSVAELIAMLEEDARLEQSEQDNRYYNPDIELGDIMETF